MSKQQQTLMRFDPATGWSNPYPSHAQQWREFNGTYAWLFNPWTGERRSAGDVGDDPFGQLIIPAGEPIYASVDASGVPPGEWGGLSPKQAWWAGYRVGKGLPADMPRSQAVAAVPGWKETKEA